MRQAETWTQAQFRSWGLKNVRKDPFEFGRGWSIISSSVRIAGPQREPDRPLRPQPAGREDEL